MEKGSKNFGENHKKTKASANAPNYLAARMTFLGASRVVTGSKYLFQYHNKNILVDCGLFQGSKEDRAKNWDPIPIAAKELDAILLTHAHLDHSGCIPLLVKKGFTGPIYCTRASYELCKIILPDSGYLQEEDAKYLAKKNVHLEEPAEPLYTEEDAEKSLENFQLVDYGSKVQLIDDISFRFDQAGHILGASIITLTYGNQKIVFSGDLGRINDDVLLDPVRLPDADYVFCESTYGNRVHKDIDQKENLAKVINDTVGRGGNIIIPAFAVGRTQLLLYYVHQLKKEKRIPHIPVFVDSPMSIKATNLLDDFIGEHRLLDTECEEIFEDTKFTTTVEQSKRIFNSHVPSVIISASGMITGGRILHHLAHYGPESKNTIVLVGFQAQGTRGRYLQDGKRELKIHGQVVQVDAQVVTLENMSAHADSNELIFWLKGFRQPPKTLFIVHGEEEPSLIFANRVRQELNWEKVEVPHYQETRNL
jgi:metallo-beta-lactamase family protein